MALLSQYATGITNDYSSYYIDSLSSQYPNTFAPIQATGAPNSGNVGAAFNDIYSAWSAAYLNHSPSGSTTEYITLTFSTPVYASSVVIRENNGNGFVTKVELFSTTSGNRATWTGVDTTNTGKIANFTVPLTTNFLVNAVKITIDIAHSTNLYEEIDAVLLVGTTSLVNTNRAPTNVSLTPATVNENVAANSQVGVLSSTDPDTGNTFSYKFATGGADNNAFTLSGNRLLIKASPDYETKASYSIQVTSSDQGGLSVTKTLKISVNNLAESAIIRAFGDANGVAKADVLRGGDGADILYGGNLNDSLYGGSGNDFLSGENDQDMLYGQLGNDSLSGGSGNDMLYGGAGLDSLTGGSGLDSFVIDSALNLSNIDKITDFSVVDDTIRLENAVMTSLTVGTLAASAFNKGTRALDSTDRIIYNSTTGAVLYDDDGTGAHAAVQIATLGTGLALTYADFIVI